MTRHYDYIVPQSEAGIRLDRFIAGMEEELSRSFAQKLILEGLVTINNSQVKPSYNVRAGDIVKVTLPEQLSPNIPQAEEIPLDIMFEDDEIIVINKPAGMVVHPGAGVPSGTLVNAVLAHISSEPIYDVEEDQEDQSDANVKLDLISITPDRPGIVHRIDKGTSGLVVVAKTVGSYYHLIEQFKVHSVNRKYMALVCGHPKQESGIIVAPIGRSQRDRKKMAVTPVHSREAITKFSVAEYYEGFSLLEIIPKTGRTHQIRVHLAHIGHPVAGDPDYGGRQRALDAAPSQNAKIAIQRLSRQALHAQLLGLIHPTTGRYMEFSSPIPEDIQNIIDALEEFYKE